MSLFQRTSEFRPWCPWPQPNATRSRLLTGKLNQVLGISFLGQVVTSRWLNEINPVFLEKREKMVSSENTLTSSWVKQHYWLECYLYNNGDICLIMEELLLNLSTAYKTKPTECSPIGIMFSKSLLGGCPLQPPLLPKRPKCCHT